MARCDETFCDLRCGLEMGHDGAHMDASDVLDSLRSEVAALRELQAALPHCLGAWVKTGRGDQNGHFDRKCTRLATYGDLNGCNCCDEHRVGVFGDSEDLPWAAAVRKLEGG